MLHQPSHRQLRRPMLVASLPFLLLGLAACGSDSKSSDATAAPAAATAAPTADTTAPPAATAAPTADTTAPPAATAAPTADTTAAGGAAGTAVAVTESEFKIDIPQTTFTAGTYTFNITNSGQFKHNVIVEGNGTKVQSDTFAGGASGSLSVPLTAGTYEVYCGVPTHKGKGMDLTITVT